MNIENVKEVFNLCCQANGMKVIRITDLAKELGVKKTVLMKFINENCNLFNTFYSSKAKKESDKVLLIKDVFLTPTDNPSTEEWLEKKIVDNLKYIHIDEWNNYGRIEGYYVNVDADGREALWRNTETKIQRLKNEGILIDGTFYIGGFGDCSSHKKETVITKEGLNRLEELGWSHNVLSPINI